MTKKIFYEKVGRRYVPVSEWNSDLLGSMPKGTHIVMCYPGGQSTRYAIDPAFAPMIAAGRYAEDAIANRIVDASSMRPTRPPVTQEQGDAWNRMCQAFGDDMFAVQWSSARDIAEAGVAAMQEEAARLLKNPAVKAAYDNFMLLCKLTNDQDD